MASSTQDQNRKLDDCIFKYPLPPPSRRSDDNSALPEQPDPQRKIWVVLCKDEALPEKDKTTATSPSPGRLSGVFSSSPALRRMSGVFPSFSTAEKSEATSSSPSPRPLSRAFSVKGASSSRSTRPVSGIFTGKAPSTSTSPRPLSGVFSAFSKTDNTTKPPEIPQIHVLAAYSREMLANWYVDDFIKRYCPVKVLDAARVDAQDRARVSFLDRIRDNPVAVVDAQGQRVRDDTGNEAAGYRVEDEEGNRMRTIWVELSEVEVPEKEVRQSIHVEEQYSFYINNVLLITMSPYEKVETEHYDVIVVGGGNAALAAALSAHEQGANVLVLEASPKEERGGNSRFAGTVFRVPHNGLDDVKGLLGKAALPDADLVDIGPYTTEKYKEDFAAVSHGRNDPAMTQVLLENAFDAVHWMKEKGVEWDLALRKYYGVDSLKPGEKVSMEAGGVLMAKGGGVGLMENLWAAVERTDIHVKYDSPAKELITSGDTILGVRIRQRDQWLDIYGNVILGSGGFSANPAMRRQYLGEGWDLVLVRGSRFNTGTMLRNAIDAGAAPVGHWGAAHASPQDINGPLVGDINVSPMMPRYAYQFGITVNVNGARFFDEGEDFFGRTYAKTGKKIADQPEAKAFQIYDQRAIGLGLLPKRYQTATPIHGNTIKELAVATGINPDDLQKTIDQFNAACPSDKGYDPYQLDGHATDSSISPPKSNWAVPISQGPFVAYAVTCGITFTYGGIATDTNARVLNNEGRHMPGLWAIGEIAGGLFYHNYPGGAGLTKGTVFGRIAGREAARLSPSKLPSTNGHAVNGGLLATNGHKVLKELNEEP
ncbi:hypothetical protein PRZ48_005494 [Zasmidium cellare]|uniref:FAD-dependent oxidoreductase 2 FAD-binding domain-containing protein n=1 Tax=Zasmidium cellare TaxID=395010 RepID=A0ABR0EUR4_ZASCE|nr:hypothetical protein PRZ48_005494 [Zasmidium cellare]